MVDPRPCSPWFRQLLSDKAFSGKVLVSALCCTLFSEGTILLFLALYAGRWSARSPGPFSIHIPDPSSGLGTLWLGTLRCLFTWGESIQQGLLPAENGRALDRAGSPSFIPRTAQWIARKSLHLAEHLAINSFQPYISEGTHIKRVPYPQASKGCPRDSSLQVAVPRWVWAYRCREFHLGKWTQQACVQSLEGALTFRQREEERTWFFH